MSFELATHVLFKQTRVHIDSTAAAKTNLNEVNSSHVLQAALDKFFESGELPDERGTFDRPI